MRTRAQNDPTKFKFFGVCMSACPLIYGTVSTYDLSQTWATPMNTKSVLWHCLPKTNETNSGAQKCVFPAGVSLATDPKCVVKEVTSNAISFEPAQPVLIFQQMSSAQAKWGAWFGDVRKAWWVVLAAGVGAAIVLGFMFLILIKYCAACMVWTVILMVISVFIALTLYLYYAAGILVPASLPGSAGAAGATIVSHRPAWSPAPGDADSAVKYKYAAYVMTVITFILLAMVVALRTTINNAVKIIKKGALALRALKWLVLYPLNSVVWIIGLMFYWIYVAASVYSAGSISSVNFTKAVVDGAAAHGLPQPKLTNITFAELVPNVQMKYLLGYHFFGLLWTIQVIQGVGIVTIAGAVGAWYFRQDAAREAEKLVDMETATNTLSVEAPGSDAAKDKKPDSLRDAHPVFASYRRALRYHLGSVVFGALLIATVQFIRAVVAYVQRTMGGQAQNNRLLKAVFCLIQCCLLCLQKCVELVTRNAFIVVAIKGTSFCVSAKSAFTVIKDNLKLLSVVNVISEIIMFLGRLAVTAGCVLISFALVDNTPAFQEGGGDELTSTWMPVLVSGLFGYAVSAAFFYVFDITVDTILVCFALDTKENGKAVHMDDSAVLGDGSVEKKNPLA